MTETDLTASGSRDVVGRHVHDLRNMIYSMELEIACLLEDPAAQAFGPPLHRIRGQLALAERGLRSLSVRFVEPARDIAAAADLFQSWQQQMNKSGCAPAILWEDPVCDAAVTVDFSAVVSVLCEICLEAKQAENAPPLTGGFIEAAKELMFYVREPVSVKSYQDTPPERQQWAEWERLVRISGGSLDRSYDSSRAASVTCLRFPIKE